MPRVLSAKFTQSQYGLQLSADGGWLSSVTGNSGEVSLLRLKETEQSEPLGSTPNSSRYDMIALNVSAKIEKVNTVGIRYGELGMQPYSFSPDGRRFAVGDRDGDVHVWELDDVRDESSALLARQTAGGHDGAITALKWQPSSRTLLLTAGADNSIRSWEQNPSTKKLVATAARGHAILCHAQPHLYQ